MRGWRISMSSSWKTPTSQTIHVSGSMPPTSELSARPMFPATATERPPELRISPRSAVVVVFPFVPVTARIGFGRSRAPSSSSSQTGMPRARAPATNGASPRTPGSSPPDRSPAAASPPRVRDGLRRLLRGAFPRRASRSSRSRRLLRRHAGAPARQPFRPARDRRRGRACRRARSHHEGRTNCRKSR